MIARTIYAMRAGRGVDGLWRVGDGERREVWPGGLPRGLSPSCSIPAPFNHHRRRPPTREALVRQFIRLFIQNLIRS